MVAISSLTSTRVIDLGFGLEMSRPDWAMIGILRDFGSGGEGGATASSRIIISQFVN